MKAAILGGGYVTARGFGYLNRGDIPSLDAGEPLFPPDAEVFPIPMSRSGRFDTYTRMGCCTIAMALKDAGMVGTDARRRTGIVLSTKYECMETDFKYYQTTIEGEGVFSSPNLFSYTLPNIVVGECAIYFRLVGPTFTVGESEEDGRGIPALQTAMLMLGNGDCDTVVAGWLDRPFDGVRDLERGLPPGGSCAVVLSTDRNHVAVRPSLDAGPWDRLSRAEKAVRSIFDLFARQG